MYDTLPYEPTFWPKPAACWLLVKLRRWRRRAILTFSAAAAPQLFWRRRRGATGVVENISERLSAIVAAKWCSSHASQYCVETILTCLDLSAAFDTVDHSLLLERLHSEFAVTDTSLDWLRSYLVDRAQFVKMGRHQSDTVPLDVGVPQGSVLGPLLFAVYCSPVCDVISQHGVTYH